MGEQNDKALLDRLLAEREAKAAELVRLDNAIETIQAMLGEQVQRPITTMPEAFAALADRQRQEPSRQAGQITIRPDQFFGMSQTQAAAAYLKMVGHAAHIDQIVEALRRGGCHVGGADPKTTLYKALVRGTRKFVLVSTHTFGLREFYPARAKIEKKPGTQRRSKRSQEEKRKEGWGRGETGEHSRL